MLKPSSWTFRPGLSALVFRNCFTTSCHPPEGSRGRSGRSALSAPCAARLMAAAAVVVMHHREEEERQKRFTQVPGPGVSFGSNDLRGESTTGGGGVWCHGFA